VPVLMIAMLATRLAAAPGDGLRALSTPQVTIAAAELVPTGPFVAPADRGRAPAPPPSSPGRGGAPAGRGGGPPPPPPLPAHCRVTMVLKPTGDSLINVELWMPAANW